MERSPADKAAEFLNLARWSRLLKSTQCQGLLAQWKATPGSDFEALVVRDGRLTQAQVNTIKAFQAAGGPAPDEEEFGAVAVQRRFMSEHDLRDCMQVRKETATGEYTSFLATIAVERGMLTEQEVYAVLELQAREGKGLLVALQRDLGLRSRNVLSIGTALRNPRVAAAVVLPLLAILALVVRVRSSETEPRALEICGVPDCGFTVMKSVGTGPPRCPECKKGVLHTALYCEGCAAHFPLRVARDKRGRNRLDACPQCESLQRVQVPADVARACDK